MMIPHPPEAFQAFFHQATLLALHALVLHDHYYVPQAYPGGRRQWLHALDELEITYSLHKQGWSAGLL